MLTWNTHQLVNKCGGDIFILYLDKEKSYTYTNNDNWWENLCKGKGLELPDIRANNRVQEDCEDIEVINGITRKRCVIKKVNITPTSTSTVTSENSIPQNDATGAGVIYLNVHPQNPTPQKSTDLDLPSVDMNFIAFKSDAHSSADPNPSSYMDESVTYEIVAEDDLFASIQEELQVAPLAELDEPPPNQTTPYDDCEPTISTSTKTSQPTVTPSTTPQPTLFRILAAPQPPVTPSTTPQPTVTPSTTPQPTVTPSTTPQPTVTPSTTPQPPVTPSTTPQPTVTPSTTPQPTVTPSTTPQPTVTPSTIPQPTVTPSTTPQPTVTPSTTPQPTVTPSTTPQPTVTPSTTPQPTVIKTSITASTKQSKRTTVQTYKTTTETTQPGPSKSHSEAKNVSKPKTPSSLLENILAKVRSKRKADELQPPESHDGKDDGQTNPKKPKTPRRIRNICHVCRKKYIIRHLTKHQILG